MNVGRLDVWTFGRLDVCTFGHLDVWRFGRLEVWTFGRLEVWTFGGLDVFCVIFCIHYQLTLFTDIKAPPYYKSGLILFIVIVLDAISSLTFIC